MIRCLHQFSGLALGLVAYFVGDSSFFQFSFLGHLLDWCRLLEIAVIWLRFGIPRVDKGRSGDSYSSGWIESSVTME